MAKFKLLVKIEQLSAENLADALMQNGFQDCRQLVIDKNINGRQFLNMTEFQLKQYHVFLNRPAQRRLWSYILRIKEHPEDFFPISTTNNKPLTLKKPAFVKPMTRPPSKTVASPVNTNDNVESPSVLREFKPTLKTITATKNKIELVENISKPEIQNNTTNPTMSLENSFINNINKLSNLIKSDIQTPSNDSGTDNEWSDDNNEVVDFGEENKEMEEISETRRSSAESYKSNREKVHQLFQGIRHDTANIGENRSEDPPLLVRDKATLPTSKIDPIYENLKELKEPLIHAPQKMSVPVSSDFEQKRKLLSATLSASLKSFQRNSIPLPPKPTQTETPKTLPTPPSVLPSRIHLDETHNTLIQLPTSLHRSDSYEDSGDEQIEFIPQEEATGPPSVDRSLKRPLLPPPNVEETYEPSPIIESVPTVFGSFLDSKPPGAPRVNVGGRDSKNNDPDCDDDGYLITVSDLNSIRTSRSIVHTPLPPIPVSSDNHDIGNNEHFINITREDAKQLLAKKPAGSFLLRPSKNYYCTLMIKTARRIFNIPLVFSLGQYYLLTESSTQNHIKFQRLDELITYYKRNEVTINNVSILLK